AGAAQTAAGGGPSDAFLVKLSNDLKTRVRSTFIGGNGAETGYAVAVDADDNVYVVGNTTSTNFPWVTAGSLQPTKGGGTDGFIAHFAGDLAAPGRATYLGGSGEDELHALAINPLTGHVIAVGNFGSTDLPITPESIAARATRDG